MSFQMFPCPHCKAEFDSMRSLEHHMKTMHDETQVVEKYRCVTCDEEFMACADWLDHREEEHVEQPAPT